MRNFEFRFQQTCKKNGHFFCVGLFGAGPTILFCAHQMVNRTFLFHALGSTQAKIVVKFRLQTFNLLVDGLNISVNLRSILLLLGLEVIGGLQMLVLLVVLVRNLVLLLIKMLLLMLILCMLLLVRLRLGS